MIMSNVLLIFVRNPELGKVKTRLAKTLGDEEALRIYQILLEKTRAAALNCSAERWLMYSHFLDENDLWDATHFQKKVQSEGDLGQRMEAAFRQALDAGAEKVVIIGSDCPTLTGANLDQAFTALDNHDLVIGPVPDGGYYLLGMRSMLPTLFRDIAWSTESVRATTLERIAAAGKTVAMLPMQTDVDTEEDWFDYLDSPLGD